MHEKSEKNLENQEILQDSNKTELVETNQDIEKKLEEQTNKLETNLEGLKEDLDGFESKDQLEEALRKNPSVAKRILKGVGNITFILTVLNVGTNYSIPHELSQGGL